jgi:hypothetical protein
MKERDSKKSKITAIGLTRRMIAIKRMLIYL